MVCYSLVWFGTVWYGLVWFSMVWYKEGGYMFLNVLEYSRTFWMTPKSFMVVGGWYICNYIVYSGPDLLNLRLNWRGPGRHLKLTCGDGLDVNLTLIVHE